MFYSDCLDVNERGHLTIGGCDAVELAEMYGTPLYVMDETAIRRALRDYKASIDENYGNGGMVTYASKACCFKELYRIVKQEGCGADVVSGGEIYTALQAGFPAERLYFHGNNKSEAERGWLWRRGSGPDCGGQPRRVGAPVRLQRASWGGRPPYICGSPRASTPTPTVLSARGRSIPSLALPWKRERRWRGFAARWSCRPGAEGAPLPYRLPDIRRTALYPRGGGHAHLHGADPPGNRRHAAGVGFGRRLRHTVYAGGSSEGIWGVYAAGGRRRQGEGGGAGLSVPYMVIEPGRSVVASAGITLYTAGHIKEIPGIRTYVSIDGGMTDNPRYALYQAAYTVVNASKADQPADTSVSFGGPLLRERRSDSGKRADPYLVRRGMCWRFWPPALTTILCPPTTTACPGPPW